MQWRNCQALFFPESRRYMITRSRLRTIGGIALPIIGGMVSQNVVNLVDTAMVGTLGTTALAAVAVGTYAVGEDDVFVNLRLIRAGDGRILSAYDFTVKNDRNISSLTPPPVIHSNARN